MTKEQVMENVTDKMVIIEKTVEDLIDVVGPVNNGNLDFEDGLEEIRFLLSDIMNAARSADDSLVNYKK